MFLFVYKSLRMVLAAIRGSNTPRQVGIGIAIGMLVGLIPKDSLMAYGFGLLVFATQVNLLATSISAFCFMWIGSWLDPVSHQLGHLILTLPGLQSFFLWLHELPIVPWTRFNNTVVMGSLITGLIMCFPVYLASSTVFARSAPKINAILIRFWLYRLLSGKTRETELAGVDA